MLQVISSLSDFHVYNYLPISCSCFGCYIVTQVCYGWFLPCQNSILINLSISFCCFYSYSYTDMLSTIHSLANFHISSYLRMSFCCFYGYRVTQVCSLANFHISSYLPMLFCCFYGYRVTQVCYWQFLPWLTSIFLVIYPCRFVVSIVTESLRSVMDNSFHNFHISSYLPIPFCCFYCYRVTQVCYGQFLLWLTSIFLVIYPYRFVVSMVTESSESRYDIPGEDRHLWTYCVWH